MQYPQSHQSSGRPAGNTGPPNGPPAAAPRFTLLAMFVHFSVLGLQELREMNLNRQCGLHRCPRSVKSFNLVFSHLHEL